MPTHTQAFPAPAVVSCICRYPNLQKGFGTKRNNLGAMRLELLWLWDPVRASLATPGAWAAHF